jgi:serine-type D-Ala-D-Ala carboxypeptidase/endopeptidase (penicillin-binding protein 4)
MVLKSVFFAFFVPTPQLFLPIFALFSSVLSAQSLPPELNRALTQAGIPRANASFLVVDLQSGATLLSHNAQQAMNPASVMKLITTAAALELLGPAYTWETQLLTTESPVNGVLQSPLYIRASGDPKITFEDLERWLARVRGHGISELAGGVVIDKRVFAPMPNDTAAFDRSPLRPYNVTPDAMLFNFKAMGFKLAPEPATQSVRLTPEPFPDGVRVEANIKLVGGACGDWRSKLRASFDDGERVATARFDGTYSAECGEREWFVSLLGHDAFFEGSFRWMWKKLGGAGNMGALRISTVPANARVLDAHRSQPLPAAVSDVNKFSNNVMARHLLLTIDREKNSAPAQAARGARTVQAWLKEKGIAAPELVIENGSGLSRDERVSATTLAALLRVMHAAPSAQLFRESLPIAGVDGTLASRFTNSNAQASAWLKTGGLNDVRTLAGYVRHRDGRMFAYVGMLNHTRAAQAFGVLEKAVDWVVQQ